MSKQTPLGFSIIIHTDMQPAKENDNGLCKVGAKENGIPYLLHAFLSSSRLAHGTMNKCRRSSCILLRVFFMFTRQSLSLLGASAKGGQQPASLFFVMDARAQTRLGGRSTINVNPGHLSVSSLLTTSPDNARDQVSVPRCPYRVHIVAAVWISPVHRGEWVREQQVVVLRLKFDLKNLSSCRCRAWFVAQATEELRLSLGHMRGSRGSTSPPLVQANCPLPLLGTFRHRDRARRGTPRRLLLWLSLQIFSHLVKTQWLKPAAQGAMP